MTSNAGMPNESTGADTGFTTNLGVAPPGSPADEMGATVLPTSGEVGAGDPSGDESLQGDDQAHERGLVTEGSTGLGEALKPRLVDDIDPTTSAISGPTRAEEGRGR